MLRSPFPHSQYDIFLKLGNGGAAGGAFIILISSYNLSKFWKHNIPIVLSITLITVVILPILLSVPSIVIKGRVLWIDNSILIFKYVTSLTGAAAGVGLFFTSLGINSLVNSSSFGSKIFIKESAILPYGFNFSVNVWIKFLFVDKDSIW